MYPRRNSSKKEGWLNRTNAGLKAFSLVESVLALGVVSFVLVSILGLIPAGLKTYRSAMNFSIEANIARQISAEILQADARASNSQMRYFDDQGIETGSAQAVFVAKVHAPAAISGGAVSTNSMARSVLIEISNRAVPSRENSYPVLVPGNPENDLP